MIVDVITAIGGATADLSIGRGYERDNVIILTSPAWLSAYRHLVMDDWHAPTDDTRLAFIGHINDLATYTHPLLPADWVLVAISDWTVCWCIVKDGTRQLLTDAELDHWQGVLT